MKYKTFGAALLALLFGFSFSAPAFAQFDSATVLGTVKDASGAIIPNAGVRLRNVATGITANTQTDSDGSYQFNNVKIGVYQITGEAQGFSKAVADNIQASVGARLRVDLDMKAGAVTDTVTISADSAQLLQTESSDRGQVINREQIVNLPLNGRAYADLALLSPGVRKSVINTQESGGRDAAFNVNGLRSSLNNFIIDGVDNNAYGTSNQGFSNQVVQASPDAVQEFKVQTNNFSAEYGRAGGAVINASIRSGTNQFHGTVYDFIRNTSLNATGFFKPTRGLKPVLQQNQFGATFGGPIIKDRTFFFTDYEGFRRITRSLQFATVPTAAQRNGQLGAPVRNPFTNVVYADGNIPTNEITPFARSVMAALALPVTSQTATGVVANNYEDLPRSQFYNDKFDIKLDHNFSSKLNGFVRISHRKVNNFEAPVIPAPVYSSANAFVYVLNQQLAGGITYNLNANSLLEFRLGISRTEAGKRPTGIGDANFRLPGLPTDPSFAGGLNSQSIGGYTQLGRQTSNPQHQDPFVWNPRVNYTWVLGRHSLKAGYEYQRINTVIEDFNPKYGQDTYGGQFSRPANVTTANNLYNLADFLFGARSRYDLTNLFEAQYRQRMHFGYLQDDFKVNQRLTLNLGVRYEYATPQYEDQNRLTNFDPTGKKLIFASDGSLTNRALVSPDRNNWAPRFGLAYNLSPKTVVRGGYGISYIHFNRLGGENLLFINLPQVVGVTIDQLASNPLCTGNNFSGCFRTTAQGYPDGLVTPARASTLTTRTNFTPQETRTGYVQSWHVTVQRELTRGLLLDVGYVGNHSLKLIALADFNQARTVTADEIRLSNLPTTDPARRALPSIQARRPLTDFGFVQAAFNGGFGNYHALQVKLERRFSAGLYVLNSFTWSKAIDNAAGHLESASGDNSRLNIRNIGGDKGLSNYNQPLNNTTSLVYDLPFGKGRKLLSSSTALDYIIGGWRATLINTMASGLPTNLTYGAVAAFSVGGTATLRPNLTGQALLTGDADQANSYLNINSVAIPSGDVLFGNAGRNLLRGPNFMQADLGLHKTFPVWRESTKLEFRMEAFNLLNLTNFGTPDGNPSNIRIVNGAPTTGGSFGTIRSAFPARQIQFALKLMF